MNKVEKLTVFFIIALLALTLVTIIIISYSKDALKETFFVGDHNCYPYTSVLNPRYSFKSKSKGWCTTADYGDMPSGNDYSIYNDSKVKCPANYSRVSPKDSHSYQSKAWCSRPQV